MFNKIFSSQSKTITGAALILGAASFVSRLVGLFRDRIFAYQFGAGDTLDVYYAAFRIPDTIYNLVIVGALSAGFIPVFIKLLNKNKNEAWKLTSNAINLLGFILIIACGILLIFTPSLMPYVVPGFNGEKLNNAIILTRIMFLSPILLGLSGIVGSVLQSLKAFLIFSLAPIFYNLGIIIGAIFLVPLFGIKGLAFGVVLGALLHLSIQLPALIKAGFHYQFIFNWRSPEIKEITRLTIPRTLSLAASQLNFLVITIIASTLSIGSLSIFNLANNLQYFPIGIIGVSFAIAAFPVLCQFVAEKNTNKLASYISRVARQIIFLIVPLTIIFLILRIQIVRVILGAGEFDWTATKLTADTLAFFSLSLFAQCLIPLLTRAFFSIHDTWTPFVIAFISALINIIGALVLKDSFGVAGLALAFSISMIFQFALLWISLRNKISTLNELPILHLLYKITIAGLVMSIVTYFLKIPLAKIVDMDRFWGIFTQGVVAGIVGVAIYAGLCLLLRVEEIYELKEGLKKRWMKVENLPSDVQETNKIE